jgi:hypothetical protein
METNAGPDVKALPDCAAAAFERDAAIAFDQLLAAKRQAGRSYPILDASGRMVFVHPDGTVHARRGTPVEAID